MLLFRKDIASLGEVMALFLSNKSKRKTNDEVCQDFGLVGRKENHKEMSSTNWLGITDLGPNLKGRAL